MAEILVTGGAGYVGSVCCAQLLERGHRVTVVDDLSTGHPQAVPPGAVLRCADIGDRSAMRVVLSERDFDTVFHFAAKALIAESVADPGGFFSSNIGGGLTLLEAVRAAGVRRFVFSSSAAVYGNPQRVPIDEDQEKNPVNAYGESKLVMEQMLRWYAAAYDWTVTAFRYFNACGATATIGEDHRPETHIIPLLLQVATGEREVFEIYGSDYPTPDGTCLRDYVHVLDIAEAHLLALTASNQPGMSVYNIGTGTSHSVRQVIRVVENIVGAKVNVIEGARRPGDPALLYASPLRLMRGLGWKPRFSDLDKIVYSAWDWMSAHPSGYGGTEVQLLAQTLPRA
jgi:UDP-glucose 4-epimerase